MTEYATLTIFLKNLADDLKNQSARAEKHEEKGRAALFAHQAERVREALAAIEALEAEVAKWQKAFTAQSNKLQKVLRIPEARAALNQPAEGER